jgi:NitT/TauT family transport system substrate-binding protein
MEPNPMTSFARKLIPMLAAAALMGGMFAPAAAQDKVKVGVFPISSSLPYFVAIERGYFTENNIEPETIRLMGGPPNVAALITNQIEVAAVLVTLEGLNANLKKPGVAMYVAMHSQNAEYKMGAVRCAQWRQHHVARGPQGQEADVGKGRP